MHHLRLILLSICLIKTSLARPKNASHPYIHNARDANIEHFPWTAFIQMSSGSVSFRKAFFAKMSFINSIITNQKWE